MHEHFLSCIEMVPSTSSSSFRRPIKHEEEALGSLPSFHTDMGVFYAYIHNIRDDNTWRMVIIFASRAVADEWWRALSAGPNKIFANNVQRISPQFYTHDPSTCNMFNFFTDNRFKPISDQFRGRMFFALDNDRGGRGISIIPPQEITDHISGNWFCIRSKVDPSSYWFYDVAQKRIRVSNRERTSFRIAARNVQDGTVMIDSDQVTIHIASQLHVDVDTDGCLISGGRAREFRFGELGEGKFVAVKDGFLKFIDYDAYDGPRSQKESWELV